MRGLFLRIALSRDVAVAVVLDVIPGVCSSAVPGDVANSPVIVGYRPVQYAGRFFVGEDLLQGRTVEVAIDQRVAAVVNEKQVVHVTVLGAAGRRRHIGIVDERRDRRRGTRQNHKPRRRLCLSDFGGTRRLCDRRPWP